MRGTNVFRRAWLTLATFVLLGAPTVGQAGPLLLLQFLQDAAVNDAVFIDSMFGDDPGSPLSFTSNVDATNNTFTYSLVAGTTYQGQAISLSGSGQFDPTTLQVTTTSSGTLGSSSWTTTGAGSVSGETGLVSMAMDADLFAAAEKKGDLHSEGDFDLDKGTSSIKGYRTDKDGKKVPNSDYTEKNKYNNETEQWDKVQQQVAGADLQFYISAFGSSPRDGGDGTFSITIASVPEPSSLIMLALGGVAGLAWGRSRRR